MTLRLGITMRVIENTGYPERRDALSREWAEYIGSIFPGAILIPIVNKTDRVEEIIKDLNIGGMILSGGNDWGEAQDRDETERIIVDYCKTINLPILGVCRGMQVLNILFGGTIAKNLKGIGKSDHTATEHHVMIEGSSFQRLTGNGKIYVNSFHNHGILIDGVARDLKVFAMTTDGIVEGLAHNTLPILAIQWHPERKSPSSIFDQQLINRLFTKGSFWV